MSFFTLLKIKWDEPGKLWDLWRLFIIGPNFFMNKTKTKTNSNYNKRMKKIEITNQQTKTVKNTERNKINKNESKHNKGKRNDYKIINIEILTR